MLPSEKISHGPYRATKLWNEAVRLFKSGMPTRRHWHQFKIIQDTFTATEAVDWLHDLLKSNRNFGPQVTRGQTVQLLCKFLRNHVFEDIFGKWGTEDFFDNGQLYRFPLKVSASHAIGQPLALLNSNIVSPRQQGIQNAKEKFMLQSKMKNMQDQFHSFSGDTIVNIWKDALTLSLKRILHLSTLEGVLDSSSFISDWVRQNAVSNESSTVSEHGMPCWVISAMQCLATWPNSESSGLPNYPGFEKDVFAAVCGYFQACNEPLLTFSLYEFFINVFIRSQKLDQVCAGNDHQTMQDQSQARSHEKVDMLRRRLLQAQMRHENRAIRRHRSVRFSAPSKQLEYDADADSYCSLPRRRRLHHNSMQDLPGHWRLNDVATRRTWTERFNSVHALDDLSEESFQHTANEERHESMGKSLPDLQETFSERLDFENNWLAEYNKESPGKEYGFLKLDDDVKSSSVENLLLDMSHQMQNEMEEALMGDDRDEAGDDKLTPRDDQEDRFNSGKFLSNMQENIYSVICSKECEKMDSVPDDVSSPMYRTMKPYYHRKKNVQPGISEGAFHIPNNKMAFSENLYMEMVPKSDPNLQRKFKTEPPFRINSVMAEVQQNPTVPCGINESRTQSLEYNGSCSRQLCMDTSEKPVRDTPCSSMIQKKNRRSLKPTKKQLEEDLMGISTESPRKDFSRHTFRYSTKKSRYLKKSNNTSCDSEDNKLIKSTNKSDIIARYEVPPSDVRSKEVGNPNQIQQRLVRLPYVSQEMVPTGSTHDNTKQSSYQTRNFTKLSRSHSSLSYRRPVRKLPSADHYASMCVIPQPSGLDKKLTISHETLPCGIHAKSCNNLKKSDDSTPTNEPPSPLTAAFDSARKKGAESSAPSHVLESLQLCLLLLPPVNRRKLQLLIRLMLKMCQNPHLVDLHDGMSTRSLVLKEFTKCIITNREGSTTNKNCGKRLVSVLIDHASVVMETPQKLKKTVDLLMEDVKKQQAFSDLPQKQINGAMKKKTLHRQMTFCKQVSVEDYEKESLANLQSSLKQLLQDITADQNMSAKEKKKKLKQFQKSYPDIYREYYPSSISDPLSNASAPKKKTVFSNAIRKLRSLRS